MENSLKEQRGLEILDINNLDKFVTECIKLPERFKEQYIKEDRNGLTMLILQVGDKIPEFVKFEDETLRESFLEKIQVAFCKFLGFDDDEHLCEWLGENPQWAPEHWCGGASTDIFNHSEHQGFASAKATTYDELINKLCELHDTYNFLVYDNA